MTNGWQTNGADGLAIITDDANPPPTEEVLPGQFWYDKEFRWIVYYDGGMLM